LIRDTIANGKKAEKKSDESKPLEQSKIEAEYEIGDLIESASIVQVKTELLLVLFSFVNGLIFN
jgi:hypothetical protein